MASCKEIRSRGKPQLSLSENILCCAICVPGLDGIPCQPFCCQSMIDARHSLVCSRETLLFQWPCFRATWAFWQNSRKWAIVRENYVQHGCCGPFWGCPSVHICKIGSKNFLCKFWARNLNLSGAGEDPLLEEDFFFWTLLNSEDILLITLTDTVLWYSRAFYELYVRVIFQHLSTVSWPL